MTRRSIPWALAAAAALPSTEALCAQRTRTLALSSSMIPPVTAHRQVAWAQADLVFLWNGTTTLVFAPGGRVTGVGFVGPGRLFCSVEGGAYAGYNVWDSAAGTWTRLVANHADTFHTDGNAAAFTLPGYAGLGLYTTGASYSAFSAPAATTYAPRVHGRYVAWQRRSGVGFTDYNVQRYDRVTGTTTVASTATAGGTDARVDESGRVLYLTGALSSFTRLWCNDYASPTRVLVADGLGAGPYRFDSHLGQIAYSRRQATGTGPMELWLEEAGRTRVLDTAVYHDEVELRGGMALWISSGLRLFDGQTTRTLAATQLGLPRTGAALDRGWVVYNGGGGPVELRESALTWDRDTVSAATGGTVRLDLIAGVANAGRQYLVLASLAGSAPGTQVGPVTLPLVYDGFAAASVALANSSLFVGTFGVLDGTGSAVASFVLPPGVAASAAGQSLTFAYLLLSPAIDFASNPARVRIVP